jgi:hypothetical protein
MLLSVQHMHSRRSSDIYNTMRFQVIHIAGNAHAFYCRLIRFVVISIL